MPLFLARAKKKRFYLYSPIKLSSATRKGALASLLPRPAKSLKSYFTTSDVCVNLNKTVSKWATAPPLVSQEETGTAQVRASQDWLCLGHYLEEQPLRGLDTVQRSRVLDMRAGNRTAWSLLIRLSIKRDGIQRSSQVLPFPSHTAPLSRSRSGVNANLSSRFSLCRHHAAAQRHPSLSPSLTTSL